MRKAKALVVFSLVATTLSTTWVPVVASASEAPLLGYRGELHVDAHVELRNRILRPDIARFTSVDPVGGVAGRVTMLNGYHYADNDPVNRFDPLGLTSDSAYADAIGESRVGSSSGSTPFVFGGVATTPLLLADDVVEREFWRLVSQVRPAAGAAGGATAGAGASAAATFGTVVVITGVLIWETEKLKDQLDHKVDLAIAWWRDVQVKVDRGVLPPGVYVDPYFGTLSYVWSNVIVASSSSQQPQGFVFTADGVQDAAEPQPATAGAGNRGPGNTSCATEDFTIYRWGADEFTVGDLSAAGTAAEAAGFPFGFSTSTRLPSKFANDHRSARVSDLSRAGFCVQQTGSKKDHYTVHLNRPVTQADVDLLNGLFT